MKTAIRILLSLTFIFAIIIIAGFTANSSVENGTKKSDCNDCVYISKWDDCSDLCTDAICYQFTNDCTNKVKINIYTKRYDTKKKKYVWDHGLLYLESGETSAEAMYCPYIEMKWSYKKS